MIIVTNNLNNLDKIYQNRILYVYMINI